MKTLSKTLRCLLILGIATCALTSCNSTTEPVESETKSSSKIISRQRLATFEQRVAELNATYASMATIQTEDNIESAQEKERLKEIAKADLDGAKNGIGIGMQAGELMGGALTLLTGLVINPLSAVAVGGGIGGIVYGAAASLSKANETDTLISTSCAFALNEIGPSTLLDNHIMGNYGIFHNAAIAYVNDNYGIFNNLSTSDFIDYICEYIMSDFGIEIPEEEKLVILSNLEDLTMDDVEYSLLDDVAIVDEVTRDFIDDLINLHPSLRESFTSDYMNLVEESFIGEDNIIEWSNMSLSVGYYSSLLWSVSSENNFNTAE